ncbi:hypothetical protein J3F84DRAFT_390031 [Trichoderma pleuroticola]
MMQGSKQIRARVGLFRIMALLDSFSVVLGIFAFVFFVFGSVKQGPLRVKFAVLCKFLWLSYFYPGIDRRSEAMYI